MNIGILGGTFDPPHLGHLLIAEEVRVALGLEEVWFIPTYTPPHKQDATTHAADRVQMLLRAIEDNPYFRVNTIEMDRPGKSYTIDTVKALRADYPNDEFYFIIGADMVEYLPNWNQIDELVRLVQFVGVKRTGYELETNYPIMKVEIPMIDISSSMLRERLRNHQSINYFVPGNVYSYIKENQLYGTE